LDEDDVSDAELLHDGSEAEGGDEEGQGVRDGDGDGSRSMDSFCEDPVTAMSRLSMSSEATNESIELPPPPPLSSSSSSDPYNSPAMAAPIRRRPLLPSDRGDNDAPTGVEEEEGGQDSCDTLQYKTQERATQSMAGPSRPVAATTAATPAPAAPAPSSSPSHAWRREEENQYTSSSLGARTDSTGSTVGGGVETITSALSDRREMARISTELSKMRMTCVKETVAREDHERRLLAAQESLQQERARARQLEEQLRVAESEVVCVQAREAALLDENSRVRGELADTRLALSGVRSEREESDERCRGVESLLDEAWQKMKAIAHSEDAAKKRAVRAEQQLLKSRDDALELERKLTLLNGDLKASFALTDRLRKDFALLKASEQQLQSALAASQEVAEVFGASARALESQVECLESDLRTSQQKVLDMDARAEASRDIISTQQVELKALEARAAQSEEQCATLRRANTDMQTEQAQLRVDSEKARVDLQQQLVILTRQATQECERLHGVISEVRAQRDAIQSSLTSEMSRSCKLGKSLDKQALLVESLQGEVSGLQESEQGLLRDLEAKQAECDGLNADLVKHKELISYINKLSTEAEAKRNK
jgi:chromosome segregation ATPase